jgi:RNA polymerase sigma factor (sigma-70 family)
MLDGMTTHLLERRAADGRLSPSGPDGTLLDDARNGSVEAFEQLFRDNQPLGVSKAFRVVRDRAVAEEIAAEAFTNVYAAMANGLGPRTTFRGYYLSAVQNVAINSVRRASNRFELSVGDIDVHLRGDGDVEDPIEAIHDDSLDVSQRVQAVLDSMPARWRMVLQWSEEDGGSAQELAARLGMSPNAVAALTYRARNAFREAYLEQDRSIAATLD